MKPRILVIHRALAPYRIDFFNDFYQRYQPDIYFEYPSMQEQTLDASHWEQRIRFPYKVLKAGPNLLPNWREELWNICRRGQYDIVFMSEVNLITATLWAYKAFSSHPMRLVVVCDDSYPIAQELIRDSWSLKKQVINYANIDGWMLCDKRTEQLYREHFPRSNRFFTMPIIQNEAFLREQYALVQGEARALRDIFCQKAGERSKLLLFVGRLAPEKNLMRLLIAFERTFSHSPEVQLLLVGEGHEAETLQKYASQSSVARQIFFCGKQEGRELYKHYAAADAFVLPSTLERFGAVANEALIMGLPTAVSRQSGIASIAQEGGSIALFDAYNVEEIGQTLQQMVARLPMWHSQRPSLMPITFGEAVEEVYRNIEYLIG
ncbi:glycosyltransferase [Porphyromonas circumdentaria]|uniref:Glycosyltransferase involved in cell wall bisynthesis n=1 Tax=Porphyromonas circumdentaria TaxID=29524 RepID=A0A1T4PBM5_9PORP|nr:glycosyltransferase [Porphyromonas circumdentaria]MBB6276369.1 glycosyltransferase involved in cell wall biosynthesis [Porphyromonas circumdentaria]MDO4722864.1 glycosyltransferase [Porphyromonas circumdentaria]SJZ88912.1 Glycosyltransferase involved in cell wall bisynthesis [Porphyromonas circumdentaria]